MHGDFRPSLFIFMSIISYFNIIEYKFQDTINLRQDVLEEKKFAGNRREQSLGGSRQNKWEILEFPSWRSG